MATFIEVCKAAALPVGTMKGFKVGELDVVVANVGGALHAMDGICPHMSGYLARGKLEGAEVVCPVHGARYDVKTGKVTKGVPWIIKAMSKTLPQDLATYPVRLENGAVLVGV
jgi:nitrite reductase/ring-hydroxylating ferredoxin subunit